MIAFMAGLPRSGSTLLSNILMQNPAVYVTPTSGLLPILTMVRDQWGKIDSNRAMDPAVSEQTKARVLKGVARSYLATSDRITCIDKNRGWTEYLEMASLVADGPARCICCVRDVRDVVASFEKLYRKSVDTLPVFAEPSKAKTAQQRIELWMDPAGPVGRPIASIKDALIRGWKQNILFVEYNELTMTPEVALDRIYKFLGLPPFFHDLENVRQVTKENDLVYGFKDLHTIRPKVEPAGISWSEVYPLSFLHCQQWQSVYRESTFWRA